MSGSNRLIQGRGVGFGVGAGCGFGVGWGFGGECPQRIIDLPLVDTVRCQESSAFDLNLSHHLKLSQGETLV